MPRDERMFSHVTETPATRVGRQRTSVLLTVLVECAGVAALLVVPLLATDVLPAPADAMAAFVPTPPLPEPPPPPRRGVREPKRPQPASDPRELAPSEAPPALAPEPPSAGAPWDPSLERGSGPGVPDGVPGGFDSIGDPPPPPPPPEPRTPERVGGHIRPPEKTRHVAPGYPPIARDARVEGDVLIEATIDESGQVTGAHVLRGHPLLRDEAVAAVRQWRFTPTLLNGVPTAVIMSVTVRFALR